MSLIVPGKINLILRKRLIYEGNRVLLSFANSKSTRHYRRRFVTATWNTQTFIANTTLVNDDPIPRITATEACLNILITAVTSLFRRMTSILSFDMAGISLPSPQHGQIIKQDRFLILRGFSATPCLLILFNLCIALSHDQAPKSQIFII